MTLTVTAAQAEAVQRLQPGEEVVLKVGRREVARLVAPAAKRKPAKKKKKPAEGPRFGSMAGQIWMAEDFDAPLEDFKDYM